MSPKTAEQQVVCVLGMHRAGTSALTRLLDIGGAQLGPDAEVAHFGEDNPTGFWELRSFREINDDILGRLGGSWTRVPFPPPGWELDRGLQDLQDKARELIDSYFPDTALWAWKDPRASITLPFWKRLLPDQKFLICVRNPLSVAASLEQRNRIARRAGLGLWFDYMVSALRNTEGCSRTLIHYEDLLADWCHSYRRVVRRLRLTNMAAADSMGAVVDEFLAPSLNHHRHTLGSFLRADDGCFPSRALYVMLRRARLWKEQEFWRVVSALARGAWTDRRQEANEARLCELPAPTAEAAQS